MIQKNYAVCVIAQFRCDSVIWLQKRYLRNKSIEIYKSYWPKSPFFKLKIQ